MKNFKFKETMLLTTIILFIGSCNKPKNYDFIPSILKLSIPPNIRINSAAELASESSANYDENQYGLITAKTLNTFVSNWDTQKPIGISGKLIIFQIDTTNSPSGQYVQSLANKKVFSYYINQNLLTDTNNIFGQPRSNGVIESESMVAEGKVIDAFLGTYGINPSKDYIVIASDSSTKDNFLTSLRLVYTLKYWGVDKKNLAFLNGSIKQAYENGELTTQTVKNTEVKQEFAGIKYNFTDNTILQATLGDIIHIFQNGNTAFEKVTPIPSNGVQFIDARSSEEFAPLNQTGITTPPKGKSCTAGTNCKVPIEGRLKGAINIDWSTLVRNASANDYRFKSKDELKILFSNSGVSSDKQIITYCDRGIRSSIVFFVSSSILGYATRLYDASWIEWSALAYDQNGDGWSNLSASSPWRTDRSGRTDAITYTSPANTIVRYSFQTSSSFSISSNKAINADKDYIRGLSGSGSGGSSGASGGGGNACGG